MICRPLEPDDIPVLREMAGEYPYPDLTGPLIETAQVITDDQGNIVAACAAERMVQCFFWRSETHHPATTLDALRLLHRDMIPLLKEKGYHGCEAFIHPNLAQKFGKRLERTFSWIRNPWPSWTKFF